jgi:glucose/arabinose dehydrogenase
MKTIFLFFLLLAACASNAPTGDPVGPVTAPPMAGGKQTRYLIDTVATGLEVPWGFAFLPNGDLMFTERPGRVRIVEGGKLRPEPVLKVPDVEPSGESGLMDISLHPQFESNKFVYLAYAYNNEGKFVKIVRYVFDGTTLKEDKVIIDGIPAAPNHAGTRARFGPDGKLYVTTGDATEWDLAQKPDSLAGKILRLEPDGTVPSDNPFVKNKAYRPEIFSLGHRNPQGIAWHPVTKLMFETEHGPSGFENRGGGADEVNIVEAGKNYGWPEIWGTKTKAGMEAPLLEYTPACAPASLMIYTGDKFPEFKGDLLFGCLAGTRIVRVKVDGRKVLGQQNLMNRNFGRIREIGQSPEGYIYFSTSNRDGRGTPGDTDDRIVRLVPLE